MTQIKQDLSLPISQSTEYESYESYNPQVENVGDFILDTRNLDNCEINTDKFKKGINDYSSIAGKMSVLTSMGIDSRVALEFIERELIREHEINIIKLNKQQ